MNSTASTIRRTALAAAMLALLAVAQVSWTQPADEAASEEPPAEQQAPAKDTTPPAPETDAQADQSPFDYQSSEEISEDRSVSYPVDI
jgi:hypothetical protein